MKKRICFFLVCLFCVAIGHTQQTTQYSQYMLNTLGLNPAYAGEKGPLEFMIGRRSQWIGFPNAPLSNFASGSMSIGKKGFYKGWHGVGFYVEQDKAGLIANKSVYLIYAYHIRLAKDYILSAGLSVGMYSFSLDGSLHDPTDPALSQYPAIVSIFPDINPGVRLYSRKLFFDFSAKHVLNNKTVELDGTRTVGTNNRIHPHLYFTVGRKFESANYAWTFTPSIQLHSTISYLPTLDANILIFYHKIIGVGISYRDRDALIAMLQFHPTRKITIGIAYDYSISRFTYKSSNSEEAMVGVIPNAAQEYDSNRARIAQCPSFDL
jgi:type IX secretion system PorP/SprF family membrane protein